MLPPGLSSPIPPALFTTRALLTKALMWIRAYLVVGMASACQELHMHTYLCSATALKAFRACPWRMGEGLGPDLLASRPSAPLFPGAEVVPYTGLCSHETHCHTQDETARHYAKWPLSELCPQTSPQYGCWESILQRGNGDSDPAQPTPAPSCSWI